MHIKLTNSIPEKYSIGQLRHDNPQVSFPKSIPDSTLAEYDVYPLKVTVRPTFDPMVQRVVEGVPALQSNVWVQVWNVVSLTTEEVAQRQAEYIEQMRQQRAEAYRQESDPLFFKAQRGEATQQEWLDKVNEIKSRFHEPP